MHGNTNIRKSIIIATFMFIFSSITSYSFDHYINSIALPCEDTISFTNDYSTQNIPIFDSYASRNSIKLYWVTGLGFNPPYLYFTEVGVYISSMSPDSGFCELLRSDNAGSDSVLIEDVNEGDTYYFRVATYDSTGQINSLSKPIMTIPGEPEQFAFSIPASQRERPLYYSGLAWSANGKNLAFLKTSGNSVNIMNIDLSTMSASQVTNYSGTEYRLLGLDWSPDSSWISYSYTSSSTVYELDYRIWLVSPNGGIPHSVTSGRVDASATWISSMSILFTKGSLESVNIPEFYTVDLANNNNENQLTSDQNIYKYNPSINHSRDLVAFCGYTGGVRYIYTMTLSGSNIEPITPNRYWSDIHPYWLADGQNIIFTSLRSGHYEIWSINIESNQIQQITRSQKRGVERFYGRPSPDGTQFAVLELGNSLNDATIQILLNNTVNVDEYSESLPLSYMLYQNYPNPFNPSTSIQYAVSSRQFVSLKVYDVLGTEIAVLVNEEKASGSYEVEFDASSRPSGIYFYQLESGSFVETKKMILLK